MQISKSWKIGVAVILTGLVLFTLLLSCRQVVTEAAEDESDCEYQAQVTGEKILRSTIEATPPQQVVPGQIVTIVMSDGYYILNHQIICGGEMVGYIYGDEFADYSWERTITVLLDNVEITETVCEQLCEISVQIPVDLPPGTYELSLNIFGDHRFPIEIPEQ